MSNEPKTLFEKVWEQHVVVEPKGEFFKYFKDAGSGK